MMNTINSVAVTSKIDRLYAHFLAVYPFMDWMYDNHCHEFDELSDRELKAFVPEWEAAMLELAEAKAYEEEELGMN